VLMKKILVLACVLTWSLLSKAQIPSAGLVAWYMGDSIVEVSGKAQVLKDVSGHGYDLVQLTATKQPLVVSNGFSAHKTLLFQGNQWMEKDFGTSYSQPITIFFVSKLSQSGTFFFFDWGSPRFCYYTSQSASYTWLRQNAGGEFILYLPALPPLPFMIQRLVYNGTSSQLFVNESVSASGNAGNNGMSGIRIGSAYYEGFSFEGEIAEIIIYHRLLDTLEIQTVVSYLMNKYAPPANLGADIVENYSLCPITLSPGQGYESYLWSTGETTSSIQVTQEGTYWVQVKDVFGRISRDTIYVSFPYHSLQDKFFCHGDTIVVSSGLTGPYTFSWNDTIFRDSLFIATPGEYRLHVVDTNGCEIRDTLMAQMDSLFFYFSLGHDTSVCRNSLLGCQSGQALIHSYYWNTGDTTSHISIVSAGTYWCEATSYFGCKVRDTIQVAIRGIRPVAVFVADTVCFGDSSTLQSLSFAFAPEQISSLTYYIPSVDTLHLSGSFSSPVRVKFPNYGLHAVKLLVVTDSGCMGDTTQWVKIRPLPNAQFLPNYACTNKTVQFIDQSSSPNGLIVNWTWDIDGTLFTNQSQVNFVFDSIGYYPVSLVATDVYGCRDTIIKNVFVRETPKANFSVHEACDGQPVRFVDSSIVSPYAYIMQYHYAFGDGNSSPYPNPTHLYDSAGLYTVTYWVKSVNGCADTIQKQVMVHPIPRVRFNHTLPCADNFLCFHDSSSIAFESLAQFLWFIGQDTLKGAKVCYFLTDTVPIHVKYRVVSTFGCNKDTAFTLPIYPSPKASFEVRPEYGVPPLDVQCYNYSTGANSYWWDFGDQGSSLLVNPTHTYTYEGIFPITLIAYNTYGCSDTALQNVYVIPSKLDLKLLSLTWKDSAGFLYPKFRIYNNSSRRVRSIAFDVQINQGIPIREMWNGSLQPGEYLDFNFSVAFQKPTESDITLCGIVNAMDVPGQTDESPSDNVLCNSNATHFFITEPYPNPTPGKLTIGIYLPEEGNGTITIYDESGRKVMQSNFSVIAPLLWPEEIDLSAYNSSIYMLCVQFNSEQLCTPIVLKK